MIPHILVIDDHINLPRFIAMELVSEGYQVSVNCDDVAERSIIQSLNPDLIILNWELRRTSCLKIYRQLRLIDDRIPIVIITAKDESSCCTAMELGIHTCLTKPFLMSNLLEAIEYHLCEKINCETLHSQLEKHNALRNC